MVASKDGKGAERCDVFSCCLFPTAFFFGWQVLEAGWQLEEEAVRDGVFIYCPPMRTSIFPSWLSLLTPILASFRGKEDQFGHSVAGGVGIV